MHSFSPVKKLMFNTGPALLLLLYLSNRRWAFPGAKLLMFQVWETRRKLTAAVPICADGMEQLVKLSGFISYAVMQQ